MAAALILPPPKLIVAAERVPFFATAAEITALLDYQRSFKYVRELRPNVSPEIHIFQTACGGQDGDSWCDDFQCYCEHRVWTHYPLRLNGRCQTTREQAAKLGWLLPIGTKPQRGDRGYCIDLALDHAHHTFVVDSDCRADLTFDSIEGNTNPAGGSNGYGVFERATRRFKAKGGTYQFHRIPQKAAA
jgi:hypothetical protein